MAPTITAAGISAPQYSDILASLQTSAQLIFGQDIDLDPDTADGQLVAVLALAQKIVNDSIIASYNAYSPATAIGAGLSSTVKINNLARLPSSPSSADLTLIGQAGTIISSGIVFDQNLNQWALPATVTIPYGGVAIATAVCQIPGAITAPPDTIGFGTAGTLDQALNPQVGWQSASNAQAAAPGAPVETDAQLRIRQSLSTNAAAKTTRAAIEAAIRAVPGVSEVTVFENAQDAPDGNGVPGHTLAAVVEGGDATAIATAIAQKSPGCGTFGTTSIVVLDSEGVPDAINFFVLSQVQIYVAVNIQPLPGYLSTTGNMVTAAIATAINNLGPGDAVYLDRLMAPADLAGTAAVSSSGLSQVALDTLSATYVVRSLQIGINPTALAPADILIPFYQAAVCSVPNIVLTVG